jgi:hypothetical protein
MAKGNGLPLTSTLIEVDGWDLDFILRELRESINYAEERIKEDDNFAKQFSGPMRWYKALEQTCLDAQDRIQEKIEYRKTI